MSNARYQGFGKKVWRSGIRFFLTPESRSLNPGFTLVEMAMVLVILGLIILTVFPALSAMRVSSQRALTQSNLQALMLATAAYVQANGCVPCPTPAGVSGAAFGFVGTAPSNPPACGACMTDPVNHLVGEGIPPFASLGLPASTAKDGWGHWISMRVDPELAASFGVAPPTRTCSCSASCAPLISTGCTCSIVNNACTPSPANISQLGMCTAGLSTKGTPVTVKTPAGGSQQAAVLFISYGSHGYGSFIAGASGIETDYLNGGRLSVPANYAACASNGYTQCNAAGNDTFVNASPVIDTSSSGNRSYDDMMVFADRNSLVSMLGNGSCQTVW